MAGGSRTCLGPNTEGNGPTPSIYVEVVAKFAKVVVRSTDAMSSLQFRVKVVATLKDALAILPTVEPVSKPEVVVIFSYDTHGESLYVRPADVLSVNARILRAEDNREEDVHATHHRVSGMNFIPDGYAVPASVREARVEAESQLVVSTAAETDTQPPSPVPDNDPREDDDDEDEPSTPREDVIPAPPASCTSTSDPTRIKTCKLV